MSKSYQWAVIGAGPAGIATIGNLIDFGVDPETIAWIDPAFKVGDFGTKWTTVASNTNVHLFTKFYEACRSFNYANSPHDHHIKSLPPKETCLLESAAEPLQWITDHLKQSVHSFVGTVTHLKLQDRHWHLRLAEQTLQAKNVVLAIGAEPKSLSHPVPEIPLTDALNPQKLSRICKPDDVVAVFGSSHSAIIIIRSLLEHCHVNKVINFYLHPLRYAVRFDDWVLFDDTGLKETTADWARQHIDGQLPQQLTRVLSTQENIQTLLPQCDKAIYATGFKKRHITVEGLHALEYNSNNGIIAAGLFGVGIAFPESKLDRYGTLEHRVGLWKFMQYIQHVMPVWLKYGT